MTTKPKDGTPQREAYDCGVVARILEQPRYSAKWPTPTLASAFDKGWMDENRRQVVKPV